MSEKNLYLKEDVYFEPLINQWYAWPHLISPATSARQIEKNQKRIMNSFINNAQLHMLAVKESVLTGGDFLDCKLEQVDDIKNLLAQIEENCGELKALSDAIAVLDEMMRNHTSGESIEPLYDDVPKALKGTVELFLDMEHRASYRFIEPLLYHRFHNTKLQSLSFGLLTSLEERPFVLSTPRLADDDHLHVAAEFNAPIVDAVARARTHPLSMDEVDKIFSQYDLNGALDYKSLFTETPPNLRHIPVKQGVRAQYIGHAGFLIESPDVSIIIDPVIPTRGKFCETDIVGYSELPEHIDYICLTHVHQDHTNIETLLQLRHKTGKIIVPKNNGGTLADPSMRLLLKTLNFDVIEVDDLEDIDIPEGRIVSIPFLGEHGDLNIRSKAAWAIELQGKKLFFGADSSNPDSALYETLGELFPNIDIFAIGMECVGAPYTWCYGALHTIPVSKEIKDSRRLNGSNFKQAFDMVKHFNPKRVFVYALGLEPWYKFLMGIEYSDDSTQIVESDKMVKACTEIDIDTEILYGKKNIVLE